MKLVIFFLMASLFSGCFQVYGDGEDFRTVPVTNNPHIVPNVSPIPGMGGNAPY